MLSNECILTREAAVQLATILMNYLRIRHLSRLSDSSVLKLKYNSCVVKRLIKCLIYSALRTLKKATMVLKIKETTVVFSVLKAEAERYLISEFNVSPCYGSLVSMLIVKRSENQYNCIFNLSCGVGWDSARL